MKDYITVGLLAFGFSALVANLSACLDPGGDCQCQPTHPPSPRPSRSPWWLSIATTRWATLPRLPINPQDGTIEVTGPQVLIDYQAGGASYEVVYDVVPVNR